MASTAIWLATSPAEHPPIPSQIRKRPLPARDTYMSSFSSADTAAIRSRPCAQLHSGPFVLRRPAVLPDSFRRAPGALLERREQRRDQRLADTQDDEAIVARAQRNPMALLENADVAIHPPRTRAARAGPFAEFRIGSVPASS